MPKATEQGPERVASGGLLARTRAAGSRRSVRSTARLVLIAGYSIVFTWGGYFDWADWTETVLWSLGAVLWVVVAVVFLREARDQGSLVRYVVRSPSLPLLLIAPAFLWLTWMPITSFLIVVVAYVLELRRHSAGDGFWFSFGLVLFVGVFAGLSMVEAERYANGSTLRAPSDAVLWAFASLLKLNYGSEMSPQTEDGRILATVVGLCALIGASLFTAHMVKWIVGTSNREAAAFDVLPDKDDAVHELSTGEGTVAAILAEIRSIRSELAELREQVEAAQAERPK